ncbi:MAG TPA: dihydroneopterin aldolase [Stellaceae bacterium]|nr:dihydroneopterin aldolase [Stellaceae bacterium]
MLRAMSKEWTIARPESHLRDGEAERYRVFVRDLVVPCSIGIYPREKGLRRRVRVNAELAVSEAISGKDDFAEAVNYETIVAGIKSIAEAGHINLVETLADRIATLCLADPRVSSVRIVVEKLDVYPETESVGVLLERRRP